MTVGDLSWMGLLLTLRYSVSSKDQNVLRQ